MIINSISLIMIWNQNNVLGCTFEIFKQHIEGMTWSNHGDQKKTKRVNVI